jgi:outer membrane receptor for ferrienterochelin and colicins
MMMTFRNALHATAAIAAGTFLAGEVAAQSLDYDSLSDLFGEPVTAGATGAPQRVSDVPATMIIITRDDLHRYPATDIPGILRHFAAMDVDRYTVSQGDATIRGYNQPSAPRLLVMINGRQVYLDHVGYTSWAALPIQMSEIQQIEVVKGPQSALYGFNAVSGVVNIITRNPRQEEYLSATVNVGDHNYTEASAALAHQFGDNAALRASLGVARADNFDAGPFGDVPGFPTNERALADIDYDRFAGGIEFRARVADDTEITLEGTYAHVLQPEMYPFNFGGQADIRINSVRADIVSSTDFGIISARAYRNALNVTFSLDDRVGNDVPFENEVTVLAINDIFKIGTRNTFRVGLEWRENMMASVPTPGNGDVGYTVTSLSGMWDRQLTDRLDLTLAARLDQMQLERSQDPDPFFIFTQSDYDRSIQELSYNAALAWRPDDRSAVRFTLGRGVQVPNLTELGFTMGQTLPTPGGPVPAAFLGDPGINPTVVDAIELAYDRQLANDITLRAAVFASRSADLRSFFGAAPDMIIPGAPPQLVFLFRNVGDSELIGAELSLDGQRDAWRWGVSGTILEAQDDLIVNQNGVVTHPVSPGSGTAQTRLNANLGWEGENWSAYGYYNYTSGSQQVRSFAFGNPSLVDVDAHSSVSFRINRDIRDGVRLSFNALNANYGDGQRTTAAPAVESRYWLSLQFTR